MERDPSFAPTQTSATCFGLVGMSIGSFAFESVLWNVERTSHVAKLCTAQTVSRTAPELEITPKIVVWVVTAVYGSDAPRSQSAKSMVGWIMARCVTYCQSAALAPQLFSIPRH